MGRLVRQTSEHIARRPAEEIYDYEDRWMGRSPEKFQATKCRKDDIRQGTRPSSAMFR